VSTRTAPLESIPGPPERPVDRVRRIVSSKAFGVVAVAITIVTFSLGSTLVKKADTAAELVAFWRMIITAVVWNVIVLASRKRTTIRNLRLAALPGIFFGFDIVCFYLGATHNTVANAEIIGAMTPFIVVPIGARYFGERLNPRALVFALFAFGGVAMVLFAAPGKGDASMRGNVFGVIALVCWAGYISCTRRVRGEMDVASFMAAMTPFATLAVLPIAVAHGGFTTVSATGWKYLLILTVMTGIVAHGLMVLAQKTIPIGSIGIAQIAQPALAAIWSYLLLSETLHGWQIVGMLLVLGGLLGFVLLNRRGRATVKAQPTGSSQDSAG
jgi:drug/metabolite transporter (DMT)-like permease